LYYNFKLFDFVTALQFPIFIYGNVRIRATKGQIILPDEKRRGMIKLGTHLTRFVNSYEQTVIDNNGILNFNGCCCIGRGSKLLVSNTGTLSIGANFNATGNLKICCEKYIEISDDCMFSWDVTLIDTDYHPIIISDNRIINNPRPIFIGKHVWLGFNCQVLKGVHIPNNCIISASSIVRKSLGTPNAVYSYPSNILEKQRDDIQWVKDIFN